MMHFFDFWINSCVLCAALRVLCLVLRFASHVSCVLCRSLSGLRWEEDGVRSVWGKCRVVSYVVGDVYGDICAMYVLRTVYRV